VVPLKSIDSPASLCYRWPVNTHRSIFLFFFLGRFTSETVNTESSAYFAFFRGYDAKTFESMGSRTEEKGRQITDQRTSIYINYYVSLLEM